MHYQFFGISPMMLSKTEQLLFLALGREYLELVQPMFITNILRTLIPALLTFVACQNLIYPFKKDRSQLVRKIRLI